MQLVLGDALQQKHRSVGWDVQQEWSEMRKDWANTHQRSWECSSFRCGTVG